MNSLPPESNLHRDCPSSCSCSVSIIDSMLKNRESPPYPFSAPRNRAIGFSFMQRYFPALDKLHSVAVHAHLEEQLRASRALRVSIFLKFQRDFSLTSQTPLPLQLMVSVRCGSHSFTGIAFTHLFSLCPSSASATQTPHPGLH
jgi:hypothetical protein